MIYLDYAATTPVAPHLVDSIATLLRSEYGNPSSVHGMGRRARTILEEARDVLADALHVKGEEVFFTSGGTEADNAALTGTALAMQQAGRPEVIISAVEHHAVLHAAEHLQSSGCQVRQLPVNGLGQVEPDALRSLITNKTGIVSVMHANNETGTIQPIAELASIAHDAGARFHTDAVQSFGKIATNLQESNVDLLSVSAHKIYGPKGIGALVIRKGTPNVPILHGGGQESGRRPGTENIAFAQAFALAAGDMERSRVSEATRLTQIRIALLERIRGSLDGVILNGHPDETLPTILNISFDHRVHPLDGEALIMNLDLEGIAVTSGSACTSGSLVPSHVLLAMGRDERTARATVRFSFGRMTTSEEVMEAAEVLERVVRRMQRPRDGG